MYFYLFIVMCTKVDKEKRANSRISTQKDDEMESQSPGTEKNGLRSLFTGISSFEQTRLGLIGSWFN